MGEALGSISIGLFNSYTRKYVKPDSRFFSIQAQMIGRNSNFTSIVLQEVELSLINRNDNPDYFYKNSPHDDTADDDGFTPLYTVKNPELVNLRDNYDSSAMESLRVKFKRCINETDSTTICASDSEIDAEIGRHNVLLTSLINFVEYEDVEPGIGPIKRISGSVFYGPLQTDSDVYTKRIYSFKEHQIALQDSPFQIMIEPVEFSMLNLETDGKTVIAPIDSLPDSEKGTFVQFVFDIS